jgi:hypothetical protein
MAQITRLAQEPAVAIRLRQDGVQSTATCGDENQRESPQHRARPISKYTTPSQLAVEPPSNQDEAGPERENAHKNHLSVSLRGNHP